jgi:NAD(P)-dependent dehydrogenase (short-subunit alcohol dehydrogenase family)
MSTQTNKPVCVVIGVGSDNGAALARQFAAQGCRVAVVACRARFSTERVTMLEGARLRL